MANYERDGYVFPIRVLSEETAAEYRERLEAAEQGVGTEAERKILLGFANMVLPFVDEIARLPAVTAAVSEVLGPDLLVLGASFFVKEPESAAFVSWHQDLTYWELSDVAEVTAWVALTPATTENGCMQFVRGSHELDVVTHRDTFGTNNMLSRGQELAVEVDPNDAVDVVLAPGEMSLHHGHMFHGSSPNTSMDRRIGLALRFIAPSMRQIGGHKPFATLVSGKDTFGHFQPFPAPTEVLAEKDRARARASMELQKRIRL